MTNIASIAAVAALSLGSTVVFTGYTDLPEDSVELLLAGTRYPVVGIGNEEGAYILENPTGGRETVFVEELDMSTIEAAVEAPVTATKAKATAKPKAATKPAAKGKTVTKAAAKPKAETKAKTTTKAAAKVKAPKVEAEAPAPIVATAASSIAVADSATVTKLLADSDALSAAKALAFQVEETFYSLGGVLAHVYNEGLYKTLTNEAGEVAYSGKRGFGDYMLAELNIQYRKGMYLIDIYTVCRQLGISEAEVAKIGWSKMKEIVKALRENPDDKDILLAKALGTREALVEHVKVTYVNANVEGETRVAKTRLTFNLFGEDAPTVQRALEAARTLHGCETPEAQLTLIAAEWSQLTESVELSLEETLRAVNARFGVTVGVIDVAITDENIEVIENAETGETVDA